MHMTEMAKFINILPQNVSDRYLIKNKIGSGGMGHVYLAQDIQLARQVAIKTIRPELVKNEDVRKRIDHECKMHAAVRNHPNIVGLYDRITAENNIFLIMEHVEGRTLTELITSAKSKGENLPTGLTVNIILQILDALQCIHQYEIIHRDIKPSNILVGALNTANPYAKLMDFGIAREILDDDNLTKLTMADVGGPGTPAYMSPERIDSKTYGEICPATDLYSVGIILYELLCLDPPFSGTLTEIFSGHLAREPDFNRSTLIPNPLREVLIKALAKKTQARYQDAQTFSIDLKTAGMTFGDETLLLTSFDPSSLNETILDTTFTSGQSTRKHVKEKYIAMATGLLLVTIVSLSFYFLVPNGQDEAEKETASTLPVSTGQQPTIPTVEISKSIEPVVTTSPRETESLPGIVAKVDFPSEIVSQKNQAIFSSPGQTQVTPAPVQLYGSAGTYPLADRNDAAINAFEAMRKEQESLSLKRLNQKRQGKYLRSKPITPVPKQQLTKRRQKYSDNIIIIPKT